MRTLLALVAAAAMIAGALYIRGGGTGDGIGPIGSSEPAELVCAAELAQVCEQLEAGGGVEVRIEDAGDTAAALGGQAPADADAWLTLAPWPAIVNENRARSGAPPLPKAGAPLGRSPLVLVVNRERGAALDRHCQGGLNWRCIGDSAGEEWESLGGEPTWGRFKPGFADPAGNATGLLVLGAAASEFLGNSEFSARDLQGDRFLSWLTQLREGVESHGSPTNTPLQQQVRLPATYDVVGTTEAEAGPLLARSPRAGSLDLRYPKNVVAAEVVLAPLREGDGADRVRSLVEGAGKTALAQAGWRVQGQAPADGVPSEPTVPADPNVPSPGALEALRLRWEEIAG